MIWYYINMIYSLPYGPYWYSYRRGFDSAFWRKFHDQQCGWSLRHGALHICTWTGSWRWATCIAFNYDSIRFDYDYFMIHDSWSNTDLCFIAVLLTNNGVYASRVFGPNEATLNKNAARRWLRMWYWCRVFAVWLKWYNLTNTFATAMASSVEEEATVPTCGARGVRSGPGWLG